MFVATIVACPRFMNTRGEASPSTFAVPHRVVLLLGVMALLTFLVEGAVLHWGALLLTETHRTGLSKAGAAYAVFAIAMTLTRFFGDRAVVKLGNCVTLSMSALLTGLGVTTAAFSSDLLVSLGGFAPAGAGAANIIPVLFSLASTQRFMLPGQVIACTITLGYLGVFAGPPAIGHIASYIDLASIFILSGMLMWFVAGLTRVAVRASASQTHR